MTISEITHRIISATATAGLAVLLLFGFPGCSKGPEASRFTVRPAEDIVKAEQFDLADIRLLDSPFRRAMERDGEYLLRLEPDRLLAPYLKEAGLPTDAENYGGWESMGLDGHSLGHYLSATSLMFAASGDERYRERVDGIVAELERAQDTIGTGYLGGVPDGQEIFNQIRAGQIDAEPFGLNGGWVPWYNMHKLFAGLRDAYLYTGSETARRVLVGLSDWAIDTLEPLSTEQFNEMIRAEFGGMNEVLADVYGITGDRKYLDLASRFNDPRIFEPLSKGEDELAGLHANTQIPKVIGAAREFEFTGDSTLYRVAHFFWNTVTGNRSYVNGGNSLNEHFGPLGELHDRLGKSTSESCNTYNMLKLTEHLMKWDPGNRAYADYFERALYNHILASQDPETGMVCYFIPLSSGHFKTFSSPEDSFWCCVGSGMENHTKYGKNIYQHSDSDLYVNLFIPSEVRWEDKGLTVRQETGFPESERTSLTLRTDGPVRFNLHIRRPAWTNDGFSISVNGTAVDLAGSDTGGPGYVTLDREWNDGDRIEVTLPMELHLESFPESDRRHAVMYGPVLLAGKLGTAGMDGEHIPYGGYEDFDGRWDHRRYEDMPVVEAPELHPPQDTPLDSWIVPVEGTPLHFRSDGAGEPRDVEFAPFYQVNHERYAIYWDTAAAGR